MQNDQNNNNDVKKQTLQFLEEAEKKRAAARFERNLKDFFEDKYRVLENTEFAGSLGPYAHENYSPSSEADSQKIIETIFALLKNNKYAHLVSPIIDDICCQCLKKYNIGLMKYLCGNFVNVLEKKDVYLIIDDNIHEFLVESCCIFVRSSQWQDFDALISKLWRVRNRKFQTPNGQEGTPFQQIFSEIAEKDIIEKISQYHCSADDEHKKLALKAIRYLGEKAILYLLNRLVFSKKKEDRYHLIQLLTAIGDQVVKPIEKFMEVDLPWYAIRNLIILIGESRNPDYYAMVEAYLVHPDVRVQKQVVACIVKLGGERLEKRLIQALPVVDDEVKLKLVMQLGEYSSEEIANGLIDLINKPKKYSDRFRQDLIYKACISLRSQPYTKVVNVLKHALKQRKPGEVLDKKISLAVKETINILEPQIRHRTKGEKADLDLVSYDGEIAENEGEVSSNVDDFIEEIDNMLNAGKVEKATALMYKKIVDSARAKEFEAAEMLRDKLLEANPDALQDVIRAAEIIEEERTSPTTSVQSDIWDELFNNLTMKEYEFFISVLRVEQFEKEEKIVNAGEIDPCLYFVSSGIVRLSCNCGGRETFLKRMQPGDVVGIGQFFSASVWTVNLIAQQRAKMHVLQRNIFNDGGEKYPELEEKIFDFCRKKEVIRDLIKMSGRDRRDYARYPIKVTVSNMLLDLYGESGGRRTFKGEMIDISRGGLSFSVRIATKKSAQQLLGRQVVSEIKRGTKDILKCFGLIVGVRYQHEIAKEFSIHVKFYNELEQQQVSEVLNLVL